MVVHAINKLEVRRYGYQCRYTGSPLQFFILHGNIFKTIEPHHFPLLRLKKLSLAGNNIEQVKSGALKNHEIENLDLSHNFLEVVESESLPLQDSLIILSIRNNNLTHIEHGSLSPSLQSLNLDHNRLRYIENEVLENLLSLKELTLSHNNFNVIPKISHLKKLVVFDISYNAISTLKEDTFKNMDDLKLVDFSNNRISSASVLEWINTPGKQPSLTVSLALNRLRDLILDNVSLQNQTLAL